MFFVVTLVFIHYLLQSLVFISLKPTQFLRPDGRRYICILKLFSSSTITFLLDASSAEVTMGVTCPNVHMLSNDVINVPPFLSFTIGASEKAPLAHVKSITLYEHLVFDEYDARLYFVVKTLINITEKYVLR